MAKAGEGEPTITPARAVALAWRARVAGRVTIGHITGMRCYRLVGLGRWVTAAALAAAAGGRAPLRAQPAPAPVPLIVDDAFAAARLGDPSWVVLHVGFDRAEYEAGHLPGARFVPFNAYTVQTTTPDTLRTELPPLDSLQRLLERAGVVDGRRVLIVGQPIPAARFAFTMAVLGLDGRGAVLDGGVDAWREAGRPLSRELPPPAAAGRLTIAPTMQWLATAEDVRAAVRGDGTAIVDARLPEFYFGYSANGFKRAGHVAGAGNVPFTTVTREVGRLRPAADLDRLLAAAGAPRGAPVVTYCHVGQQASVLWLAARVAGRQARMYDGSFQEWSRLGDAPIATLERR